MQGVIIVMYVSDLLAPTVYVSSPFPYHLTGVIAKSFLELGYKLILYLLCALIFRVNKLVLGGSEPNYYFPLLTNLPCVMPVC